MFLPEQAADCGQSWIRKLPKSFFVRSSYRAVRQSPASIPEQGEQFSATGLLQYSPKLIGTASNLEAVNPSCFIGLLRLQHQTHIDFTRSAMDRMIPKPTSIRLWSSWCEAAKQISKIWIFRTLFNTWKIGMIVCKFWASNELCSRTQSRQIFGNS